jgi:hypothetical protein
MYFLLPLILLFLYLVNIPFITTKENFLQFDLKKDCPNPPISSLGILVSLTETEDSTYENTLSPEERKAYEDIIDLKRSFSSTMSYIPQSFAPEKEEYWEKLEYLLVIFIIIAAFPAAFIIFYLFVRFVLHKCTGPKKIKQVTKMYRNMTWFIMIVASLITIILFSIVLGRSIQVKNYANTSFNFAVESIKNSENVFDKINDTVKVFKNSSNTYPLPTNEYMEEFQKEIKQYNSVTKERTNQILNDEKKRSDITLAIYIVYLLVICSAYLIFFLKREKYELFISIILFFSVPGLLILEGFNAKYFFFYSDMCDSVNSALYSNEFPVADQSLGYYYNCFPTNTKAMLYNIRYKLYQNLNDDEEIINSYKILSEETLDKLFNCEMVNNVLPNIEREFCKDSLEHMYSIVTLLPWILLSGLCVAIGSRRLQVLIWKKKMEIEEMIENKEAIF